MTLALSANIRKPTSPPARRAGSAAHSPTISIDLSGRSTAATEGRAAGVDSLSLDALAAAAQKGSETAFEALVREAGPRVMRFLSRRLRDEHLAEDLTQDAFLSAHRALASYDPRRPFLPWLFTSAVRLATDVQRSRSASLRREKAVAALEVQPPPDGRDEGDVWGIARRELSEGEYAAVWMRYAEEFDIPEVARAINKSGVATRVMLLRARRKLEKALAHEVAL